MSMPKQKPGNSRQDYGTPQEFIDAVLRRFGPLVVDLAATGENAKARNYITPEVDSLSIDWSDFAGLGHLWLNPPFEDIAPWAAKCARESANLAEAQRIFFLVPASVGSNWYAEHVHNKALVHAISPRLSFDGKNPYPKDCILCEYNAAEVGFVLWRWK